jgi:uncharacterized protein YbaP (TraB family)
MSQPGTRVARILNSCTAALLALFALPACSAGSKQHVFWEVAGRHNTVYLLGSVHLLHENDRALPPVTESAFLDAEVLVEELDIYALMGAASEPAMLKLQFLPQPQTLVEVLGAALHKRLGEVARPLGLDMDYISRMQPWYVATLVSSARLARAGYNPLDGVDYQLAERAHREHKPIEGLETPVQQMAFFASMSMAEQRKFLAASLDEDDSAAEMREITAAWRRGDLAELEKQLKSGMEETPELFQQIVVERNRNWLPRIEQMLAEATDKDYLVVTGALHMVGPQGLVELLRARGYRITRK